MKTAIAAAALIAAATTAFAEPQKYALDPSHSQILFAYNHLGYSTTYGLFSGFEGEIVFDRDAPAQSSVVVSMPVTAMLTGWQERFDHFMSPDFFSATENDLVTFRSTSIEVTGEVTALITGDLTLNGITKPVVLDANLNQIGDHPMAKKPWAGFDATAQIKRSDFDLGMFAPFVSDEVEIEISIEAMQVGAAQGDATSVTN